MKFAGFVLALLLTAATTADAEQIRVLSSVAMKAVIEELVPAFARATHHTVAPEFGIAADIRTKIEKGAPFDVAVLTPALLDDLAAKGLVDPKSRVAIARTGLGLMIKSGAAKPDLSSVDAFKRAIQSAQAITYVPTGASGIAFVATMERLGMSAVVKAKTMAAASGEAVNANIVNGAADVAVLPVSEILPVRGAELGGVFPPEIQTYIVMAAGVNAKTRRVAAARAFVDFLNSPRNTPAIVAKGMER